MYTDPLGLKPQPIPGGGGVPVTGGGLPWPTGQRKPTTAIPSTIPTTNVTGVAARYVLVPVVVWGFEIAVYLVVTSPILIGSIILLQQEDDGEEGSLGDLTPEEIEQIQDIVDKAGVPLEVVGSAAKGKRTKDSDIDYVVPISTREYIAPFENELPDIDPEHGILNGPHSSFEGPSIRFEPGQPPQFIPQKF